MSGQYPMSFLVSIWQADIGSLWSETVNVKQMKAGLLAAEVYAIIFDPQSDHIKYVTYNTIFKQAGA